MARDREELAAELAVLELEELLVAAKDDPPDTRAYRDLKLQLRAARHLHRTLREGGDPGEGVARPATVETGTEVH